MLGALAGAACSKTADDALAVTRPNALTAASTAGIAAAALGGNVALAPLPPLVRLDGSHVLLSATRVESGRRVYSVAARAWIYAAPDKGSPRLGYLRVGGSAPIASDSSGVTGKWVEISPQGYLPLDADVTLDAHAPLVRLFAESPPDFERKLPYIYGSVRNPGPIYNMVPDRKFLQSSEPDLSARMDTWLQAPGEIGAGFAQEVWTPGQEPVAAVLAWREQRTEGLPELLQNVSPLPTFKGDAVAPGVIGSMRAKTGYAFLETFLFEGRRYGVTTSLKVLPTDRLRPIRGSEAHGYVIGKEATFPFAIVRSPIAKFKSGEAAAYWSLQKLTGKQQFFDGVLHYETVDKQWLSDRFASRVEPAKKMPRWGKQGDKWLDVNLTKQTLVAYEGEQPVFATLISSGEAGLESPESTTATKRGIFRIHTKHVTSTMSSSEVGEEFELQDVPYVQYFDHEGYALHAAYWHDRFGIPKSHGCINLAPEDARRLFFWTDPPLPLGWHGVLSSLKGTVVFVHP